jgi:hypothetical protein
MFLYGNESILQIPSTAFLCSRQIPASAVLKCYDWAISMRESGKCVISGFHSPLEKDVFDILMKGNQPIIIALARGMRQKLEPQWVQPMNENRLLIVTPFEETHKTTNRYSAKIRNQLMIDLATDITVGFLNPMGSLTSLISSCQKPISYLS